MLHAEALLLVHDDEAQVMRVDVARQQAMRAHEHAHLAAREALERQALLLCRAEAAEHLHLEVERGKAVEERLEVLLGEDRGGAQHHDLAALGHALERGTKGNLGLAEAHVSAQQAVHGPGRLHVGLDVVDGGALVCRECVGEGRLHLLLLGGVRLEGMPLDARTTRVQVHEVKGEALGVLAGLVRCAGPVRRVQAREARARAVRANVARDAVHLLERHEELVAAGILEKEVVALATAHLLAHDVGKQRDAVRGVDDVVARLERKRYGRGVDAAARAVLGHVGGEVAHGQNGELGRGRHDAGGHGGVDERHLAARQRRRAGGLVGLGVCKRHAVLGGAREGLAEHDVLVAKIELEMLARRAVRHGEQHREAVAHELADAAEKPRVAAGDARLANGQLRGDLRAHAQHARERQALLAAEVHVARGREQALRAHAGVARKLLGLL